jgi:transcription initiation factor TFIIIB Brf1 subunit/transcription initiation factor TFIIB
MKGIDFFNSLEYLEPKCPKCAVKIEWGVNTVWDDENENHVCRNCGSKLG